MEVSAPGKIILFGEHAVVYGKRAVAISVGLQTTVRITPMENKVQLDFAAINVKRSWQMSQINELIRTLDNQDFNVKKPIQLSSTNSNTICNFLDINPSLQTKEHLGLLAFFHMYCCILSPPLPLSLTVKSQMPVGGGLGSSASYAVALCGSLLWAQGIFDSKEEVPHLSCSELQLVCDWAYNCERIVHGTPSGIDNSVCTYGGAINFKSGQIETLIVPPLNVLLVNTNVVRNTKTLVANVRALKTQHPIIIAYILDAIDSISDSAISLLKSLNNSDETHQEMQPIYEKLDQLIDFNQCLLKSLEVSHAAIDDIVQIAKQFGLHAKLTGAGGGGFVFVHLGKSVPQESIADCMQALQHKGYHVCNTHIGSKGILFNKVDA